MTYDPKSIHKRLPEQVSKLLSGFQSLSFDDKKKKLLNVVGAIDYEVEELKLVKDAILNNPNVDDEFLDGIYTDFMLFAYSVQEGDKKKAAQSLKDSQTQIQKLHQREEIEKKQEEKELDDMLGGLDDI